MKHTAKVQVTLEFLVHGNGKQAIEEAKRVIESAMQDYARYELSYPRVLVNYDD